MASSVGFRVLVSLHPATQATGLPTFAPVGLIPTECASLCWTHESAQRSLLVAARVFAESPTVTLYTEGFDRFVTCTTTPMATGWRGSCRVGLSPTERAHVFTAHAKVG